MNKKHLGEVVSALRGARPQDEIAELSGVSRRALQRIEAGDSNPKLDTLIALSKSLGTTLEDLIVRASAQGKPHQLETLKNQVWLKLNEDPIKRQYLLSVIFGDPAYVSPEAIEAALQGRQSQP